MVKRVLVAIDLEEPIPGAVNYARQLAARLGAHLMLLGIVGQMGDDLEVSREELSREPRRRLEMMVSLCRREGMAPEIYLSQGRFWEEVGRFLQSNPWVQFLVVAAPRPSPRDELGVLDFTLKRLKQVFPGEILLVREQEQAGATDWEMPVKGRDT